MYKKCVWCVRWAFALYSSHVPSYLILFFLTHIKHNIPFDLFFFFLLVVVCLFDKYVYDFIIYITYFYHISVYDFVFLCIDGNHRIAKTVRNASYWARNVFRRNWIWWGKCFPCGAIGRHWRRLWKTFSSRISQIIKRLWNICVDSEYPNIFLEALK